MAVAMERQLDPARLASLGKFELTLQSMVKSRAFQSFVEAAERDPKSYPEKFIHYLRDQGYLGADIPEKYGGLGMAPLEAVRAAEVFSEEHAGTGLMFIVQNSLTAYPIARFGTEEQKERYLRPMAEGKLFASYAITEPDTGSDAKNIQLRAEWDEKSHGYFLTGRKRFITGANRAGIIITDTRTGSVEDREAGISAFIVEVTPDMEGFSVEGVYDKVGQAGSPLCELVFDHVWVPETALLGKKNEGWKVVEGTLQHSRNWIAAQGLGIARRAYKEALAYGGQRKQFGKLLVEHADYKNHLDVLGRQVEILEHLVEKAALKEEEQNERPGENLYSFGWATLAKWVSGETALREASDAMLLHGGIGYTEDMVIARVFRDSPVVRIYEGSAHILLKVLRNLGMPIALLRLLDPVNGQLYPVKDLLPASMINAAVDAWEPKPVKK